MANPAITKRRAQLEAEGKDPGVNYGAEYKVGGNVQQLTEYGVFIASPTADSAWFIPDVGSLARFR